MSDPLRVGFIGLGDQGAPMAIRIVEAGMPLRVWARRPASLDPFRGRGAGPSESASALGAESDVVCLCVWNDEDVREVSLPESGGVLAGMAPGSVLVIHSTVHPRTIREVAERARAQGVSVLDAPVSGGGQAALDRNLTVMVGGETEVFERCRAIFESYGAMVRHVGPLTAGAACKLLNNAMFAAQLEFAAELGEIARTLELDVPAVLEIVRNGSGASFAQQVVGMLDLPDPPEMLFAVVKDSVAASELLAEVGRDSSRILAAAGALVERLAKVRRPD